jgi:hypothetical protein
MSNPGEREPPRHIWYTLEEALELLAVLEDARDSLIDAGHLTAVVATRWDRIIPGQTGPGGGT